MQKTRFYRRIQGSFSHWRRLAVAGLLMASGCATAAQRQDHAALNRMQTDLDAKQYHQVLERSSQFLASTPKRSGSAAALYLRGRAYEDQPNASEAQAKANLQNARAAYVEALDHHPSPTLQAYIRASIANVAYFQNDYTTAAQQWMAAYPKLDQPDLKAWSLYRAGVSRQRLGEFSQADSIFKQVVETYPNTTPAQRAKERQGARAFYVQLGAFSTQARANTAATAARRGGLAVRVTTDAQNHHVVQAGPVSTYAAAEQLRQKLAGEYEGAFVYP